MTGQKHLGSLGKTDPIGQGSHAGLGPVNHSPQDSSARDQIKCLNNFPVPFRVPAVFWGSAGVCLSTNGRKRQENGSRCCVGCALSLLGVSLII